MFVDANKRKRIQDSQKAWEKFINNCEDEDLLNYINDLLSDKKKLQKQISEYEDFFEKLASFIPRKFSIHGQMVLYIPNHVNNDRYSF